MDEPDAELLRREEEKRLAAWAPAERWRVIWQTIAWAESQGNPRRNSPAGCKAAERRALARLGELPSTDPPAGEP